MKRLFLFLLPICALVACNQSDLPEFNSGNYPDPTLQHGMIQLGQKLDDPYTVANMQQALVNVYGTKAERVDITATDLYVRFLPKDNEQFMALQKSGLYLLDHPMDYEILREGDYYQDPEVGDNAITWQYAVVPRDKKMPEGIHYELLDEVYISEHAPATRAASDIDWAEVEKEAFRLTGNERLLAENSLTKAESQTPSGRITIEDPLFSGGKPFGVAGVKVVANIFVKIATCYTDRDGYYQMTKKFSGTPRYRLVFQNEKDFNIGFNFLLVPASVSTLGKGESCGIDLHVTQSSEGALFRRCVVNNAAYDYYSRCTEDDLDITPPPGDLRIWIFPDLKDSSASMLHHGAFINHTLIQTYVGVYLPLVKIFLPDITIGTKERTYSEIYEATIHELAHASHFAQVGVDFWTPYVDYVIQSFITEGAKAYGSGNDDKARYCEIGEMWGFFMQATLKKDRYGGTVKQFGNSYWFKPDIFTYLYERGISRGDLFRALTSEVTSIDDLKEQLITLLPDRETVIRQTFQHYGK
jgi:hypothetical protein